MIISFNNYPTTFNHNHFFKDVTEKDFPCGEIKEEKGIQVGCVSDRCEIRSLNTKYLLAEDGGDALRPGRD